MRAIFLDFDGVLNNGATLARIRHDHADFENDPTPFDEAEYLEPKLVQRAGALALRTGAAIVVVSSWKERFSRLELERMLRARGLPAQVPVYRCERWCAKGEAIRRFLVDSARRGRGITAYVVLDDGPGPLPREDRLVQPSGAVGLTEAECDRAEAILLGVPRRRRRAA